MLNPFANDDEVLSIGELCIENGFDSIELYGELSIAYNNDGLIQAKALQDFANRLVAVLENAADNGEFDNQNNQSNQNPDSQTTREWVDNPFA
ncbi:hypothetical protein ACFBZI_02270 [Moraxella sp. ZJ142]|uniref:hypothetical protein n=1 Tax=Moraxella marmotae TaxID=3344520 RepID=UPI0035D475DA